MLISSGAIHGLIMIAAMLALCAARLMFGDE